jgi:lipopolysaccharide/colanic/teichoic acid biosynthesis glycosyltransferase
MIRFFDISFSALALTFLSPLLLPIILILKFSGEGEVFFYQDRVGKNFTKLRLIKFATMLKNSENIGTGTVTVKNDPRILPFGNFLRKTKINELPQLINIFLGDMSVIGPRPQTQRCFDAFNLNHQKIITKIKPGLSGIGPVVFRDEESLLENNSSNVEFYDKIISPYKGEVESWYVKNYSLKNYFILIFITLWVVIRPKSKLVWKIFKNLPVPPDELKLKLNYYD